MLLNVMQLSHRFVFDGGAGHTQVELAVLLDAGVDQGLDRSLLLEEQEGVAWREEHERISEGKSFNNHTLVTL